MKRILALALTVTSLLAIACGGGAPTSPSRAVAAAPPAAIAVAQSTPSAMFGASAVDFARCLQSGSTSGCFTGHRVTPRDAGSATAPDAPSALTATANGGTVTLTWRAPTGTEPASSYVIEAGSASGLADLANFATNSTATSFTASGVGAGTFYVRIRAQNSGGVSGPSNESILTVGGSACTSAPNAPGGLMTSATGSTVTLTWTAPTGGCAPTAYILQAGSAAGLSNLANSNTGNTAVSYIAAGIGAGTYFVRILAANAYGQSAASNESTLVVGDGGGGPVTLTILPAALPTLTVGVPVSITFSVVGGTGTGLVFGLGIGSQIPGLTINTPTPGLLSGTPTTAGPYLREFTVRDSAGNTGRITYAGTVNSR